MELSDKLNYLPSRDAVRLTNRVLKSRSAYYIAAAVGLALHLFWSLPIYTWYDRLLAWLPLVIFLFLLRKYVCQSFKNVPFLVLVALQVYIFFCVPQFTQQELSLSFGEIYTPSGEALTTALLLTVIGELLFLAGYHLSATFARKPMTAFYRLNYAPTLNWTRAASFYSIISFIVYAVAALSASYLPVSIRYLSTQLFNVYLALAILLFIGYRYDAKRLVGGAYLLAVGMSCVGLVQGMLSAMVAPLFVLFLAKWIWGKVFATRWVVVGIFAVIFINPVKNEFRLLPSWVNPNVASIDNINDRLRDWSVSFERVWLEREAEESVYMSTASRTNDLLSFAQAVDYVPDVIPYNSGEGLTDAMLFWIPRILWPEKGGSTDLIYNRYAVLFGYLSSEDLGRTAVGVSVFAEGYWNFGTYGVLGFLFVSGVLLGTLFGNNGRTEQVSTLVCLVYVAPSILALQALSVTLASLPSFLVAITIALKGLSVISRILGTRFPASDRQLRQLSVPS